MELHGDSIALHVEMPKKACKVNNVPSSLVKFSCHPICSFSNQEHPISDSKQRSKSTVKLFVLIVFYAVVMAIEIVGGLRANSLAILTDAAHLLSDMAGFSISLFTVWASGWNATLDQSFGFHRIEVLGALLSVQLIWLISGVLIYEALDRIVHKNTQVDGKLMFAIAAFGFMINFIMVVWLGHGHDHDHAHGHSHCHDHDHEEESTNLVPIAHEEITSTSLNINIQGAYLHVIADLIQSVGVMIGGSIIWLKPEWIAVDLICTLIFSVFALAATLPMLKNIFSILMEGTPGEIDVSSIEKDLKCMEGVIDIHDLHVWAITVGKFVLACHVLVEPGVDSNEILHRVKNYCEKTYRIHHVTIQIEQDHL